MATHLIPLEEGFGALEFLRIFLVATTILLAVLWAIAGLVEASTPEFRDPKTRWNKLRQIFLEMRDSISNPPVAVLTTMLFSIFIRPLTPSATTYGDGSFPSLPRLLLEVVVVFWAADIFIYFEHRLMHTPFFYKRIHKTHHSCEPP